MPVKISIITPTYNEEDNVETCYTTIRDIFDTDLKQYELEYIFTDNCSTDGTARQLRRLAEQDPRAQAFYRRNGVLPDGARKVGIFGSDSITEIRMVR